jgi:predicted nucleic acid-binding protein
VNALAGVTFVDTNILVYSHDTHNEVKHRAAENLLAQLWTSGLGVLSTQVLQEFSNAAIRKLQPPMTPSQARQVVHDYSDWCLVDTDPFPPPVGLPWDSGWGQPSPPVDRKRSLRPF